MRLTITILVPLAIIGPPVGVAGEAPRTPIAMPGPFPYGLAWDGRRMWTVDFKGRTLHCVDLDTGQVETTVRLPVRSPAGLCCFDRRLLLVAGKMIYDLHPETGACTNWVKLNGEMPTGLASDDRHVFVADRGTREITGIDLQTRRVVRRFPTPGQWPRGMTCHDGALWCVDSAERVVHKIDPSTGRVLAAFMPPNGRIRGIAHVGGVWWFSERKSHSLVVTRAEKLSPSTPGNAMRSNRLRVRVKFTDTIENRSPKAIQNVTLRMAIPPETPRQSIRQFSIVPRPAGYRPDRFGQRIAFYEFARLDPDQSVKVEWTADADLWAIRYTPDDTQAADVKLIPESIRERFTCDAPILNLMDPFIQSAAQAATANAIRPLRMALQIRDYVFDRVRYVRDGRWDGAKTVLERGEGSCSEYAYVFSALARANGLPTRFVGATVFGCPEPVPTDESDGPAPGKTGFVDRVFHRWVEIYIPPFGWLPIDANRDDAKQPPYPRRLFLALGERLLVLSKTGWGDQDNLSRDYRSFHSWSRGVNTRQDCKVKTSRVALWERLDDTEAKGG